MSGGLVEGEVQFAGSASGSCAYRPGPLTSDGTAVRAAAAHRRIGPPPRDGVIDHEEGVFMDENQGRVRRGLACAEALRARNDADGQRLTQTLTVLR